MPKIKAYENLLLLILLFASVCLSSVRAQEWVPEGTRRTRLNFNGDWLFYRGEIKEDAAKNPAFKDTKWQMVRLPHYPQLLPLRHPWKPDNEGISWYRKHFHLSKKYKNSKIFIEFEGADQVADVWINGAHITTHTGPYLPFMVDITDEVEFGDRDNVVAVKVSNYIDRDIPVYGNWISYGGLYRDVHLHITDRLYITDAVYARQKAGGGIFVTSQINKSAAYINIKTHVLNEYRRTKTCRIKTQLIDAELRPVSTLEAQQIIPAGKDHTFEQEMRLTDFHLWHPYHPYLYQLRTEIYDDEKLVDHRETRIGIRRIEFSRADGFRINGKRLIFMGTNRVQEFPYVAWAFPNSAQKRDALRLKAGGFQYVRSSHNPQDPAFLEACDELGILVMDCIPGFQYIGGVRFRERCYQNMRDMIRRDRNHPSIILWELSLNETDFDSSFAKEAMRIGHAEYPGDQCFVAGWKFPSIYDVFIQASQHGARNYSADAPLVISEYGHWDYGGGNSTSDVDRMDGEVAMLVQAQNHQESLNLNRGLALLCGDGLWVGIDFQCYPSGVLDYFRIPKFSYYFYQSQRNPALVFKDVDSGPMVFIANYWTERSPRTVTVYSNCERINLYLNAKLIASQKPDTGHFTENLRHPPFTFRDIAWQPGKLKAVGYINGKDVAAHTRMTPREAAFIDLRFDLVGAASANGEDMFFVYAAIVDRNGTIVHSEAKEIVFQVSGSGTLISPAKVRTEAGIASALIRTTTQPGQVVVKAETDGLKQAIVSKNCISNPTTSYPVIR